MYKDQNKYTIVPLPESLISANIPARKIFICPIFERGKQGTEKVTFLTSHKAQLRSKPMSFWLQKYSSFYYSMLLSFFLMKHWYSFWNIVPFHLEKIVKTIFRQFQSFRHFKPLLVPSMKCSDLLLLPITVSKFPRGPVKVLSLQFDWEERIWRKEELNSDNVT